MENPANAFCVAIDGEMLAEDNPLSGTGTGYGSMVDDLYPFPRIYSRSTAAEKQCRDDERTQARLNNQYNDSRLPGAVIHDDVLAPEVVRNSLWKFHGDESTRQQFAQEDLLGLGDDAEPGEDGVDVYESMWHYFEKNCDLWVNNQDAEAKLQQLLASMTEQLIDNDNPENYRVNVVDPIIRFAPDGKPPSVDHLDYYPPLPERYPKQPFDEEFRDDDVFAWVQQAYASPYYRLEQYTTHLANFKVTNAHFRRTEPFANDDLDQAMADGRVFIVNFEDFHEFNIRESGPESNGARLFASIAMFAVPLNSDKLKVIAIQGTQDTPRDDAERQAWKANGTQEADRPLSDVLTPADDYWSWQMAKSVFMGMYSTSSVVDHLSMHVFLGAIPVGFYRNIPKQHPLTALMETHMQELVLNNYLGIFWDSGTQEVGTYGPADKGLLTNAMGKVTGWTGQSFIDATVKRSKIYDFVGHSTPLDRSQPNPYSAIGDMPVIDDQGTFPIIEKWARNYLSLYYRYDSDVANDHELQAFCNDTATLAKVAGFPSSVSTIDELVDMSARLIFWFSVNHGLEATLGCSKFAPLSYWSETTPANDEVKTEQDWLNINAPINIGLATFCASRFFVDLPRDWYRSLGRFPEGQFMHDRRVYQHLKTFQEELLVLENQIQATNENRRWAYSLMRPSTMTCSPWN